MQFYCFNTFTNQPQTGDAANLSIEITLDGGNVQIPINLPPIEVNPTIMPGWYQLNLAGSETLASVVLLGGKSSTPNVLIRGMVQTFFPQAQIPPPAPSPSIPGGMTPTSSTIPYITPSDVLFRKDWRVIAQLVNDNPGTSSSPNYITFNQLLINPNFLTIIDSACGKLESAVFRSKMYQVGDLYNLDGMSLQYMKTIISNIVMYECYSRRTGPAPSEMTVSDYNDSMKALDDLADGTRIFSFQETVQAGLPTTYQQQPYDYAVNQNLTTIKYGRFFGIRNNITRF